MLRLLARFQAFHSKKMSQNLYQSIPDPGSQIQIIVLRITINCSSQSSSLIVEIIPTSISIISEVDMLLQTPNPLEVSNLARIKRISDLFMPSTSLSEPIQN